MSDLMISGQAQAALEYAQNKAKSTYQAGSKFGMIMMLCVIVGCSTLPFLLTKKTDMLLTDSIIYIAATLIMGGVWLLLGRLNEIRVTDATLNPTFRANKWGSRLELCIYYAIFLPLIFFIIFWGSAKLGYFGFNYSLLFVAIALCSLIAPPWLAGLTIILQVFCFSWIATNFLNWDIDFADSIGIAFGLSFTAMMIFFWKNESIMRSASDVLVKELGNANEKLREFSLNAEELATTQERNRIAREIHDTLGHSLTVVNVQLEAAEALIDKDKDKAKRFITKARELAKEGLHGIRASVSSLRASPLDGKTLLESFQDIISQAESGGTEISLNVEGDARPLHWQFESALYRTAQEALTNTRKHAQAKRINVLLDYSSDTHIQMTITDDGVGCDKAEGGFGLLGIKERVQFLNGEINIKTSTGEGFRLEVKLPL